MKYTIKLKSGNEIEFDIINIISTAVTIWLGLN